MQSAAGFSHVGFELYMDESSSSSEVRLSCEG